MSGDHGLRITVPAALQSLRGNPKLHLHLVGDSSAIEHELASLASDPTPDRARLTLVHAIAPMPMDAKPAEILRGSQDSSMHLALGLLADGEVDGVVSAGNTAALMVLGRRQISMLPGFSRPAFCSAMPVRSGSSFMLDLGANVDCDAVNLHEFALMGTALVSALEESERPSVALLSNGKEDYKGLRQTTRSTLQLIAASNTFSAPKTLVLTASRG